MMSVICCSVSVETVVVLPSVSVRVTVVSVNSTYSPTVGSIFFFGLGGCCGCRRWRLCCSAARFHERETRINLTNGPIIMAQTINKMQMTINIVIGGE